MLLHHLCILCAFPFTPADRDYSKKASPRRGASSLLIGEGTVACVLGREVCCVPSTLLSHPLVLLRPVVAEEIPRLIVAVAPSLDAVFSPPMEPGIRSQPSALLIHRFSSDSRDQQAWSGFSQGQHSPFPCVSR